MAENNASDTELWVVGHKLPSLDDLYSDRIVARKTTQLNVILNAEPKSDWVKEHPMVKGLKYIPVEKIEYLLTNIFLDWSLEVKEVKQLAQSVIVSVRLHYTSPIDGEKKFQDGIGAMPIQTEKGCSAADLSKIKSNAIQLAAPAAESYALKDAAEKIGKIFGKDLSRRNGMTYSDMGNRFKDVLGKDELTKEHKDWDRVVEKMKKDKKEAEYFLKWYEISDEVKAELNLATK